MTETREQVLADFAALDDQGQAELAEFAAQLVAQQRAEARTD